MTTDALAAERSGSSETEPALLDVRAVATLLAVSERTVYRLSDAGRLPKRIKLGALVRWRRGELLDWIAQGCPRTRDIRGAAR